MYYRKWLTEPHKTPWEDLSNQSHLQLFHPDSKQDFRKHGKVEHERCFQADSACPRKQKHGQSPV